ncbi:MAG: hypothetical protein JWN56_95 [Sphingobacteriales bacterium]|nr:hypothetical protein [Sphingobacteriales bacterium]
MKKIVLVICSIIYSQLAFSQQFSLYNSNTLYDAFENPSEKAFQADSSKKFATNIFIPTFGVNGFIAGPAQESFRSSLFIGVPNATKLELGTNRVNRVVTHTNAYLLMFRIFKTEKYNTEMGFSWQVRNDGNALITNETLALLQSYKLFKNSPPANLLNNKVYNQSYHQASITYREDYNRRLSLGVKISILNGITYNKLTTSSSNLSINTPQNTITASLKGNFLSSFKYDEVDRNAWIPNFKNPGLSMGFSAGYKFKNGVFMLANLKDVGFILWSKNSYKYTFDRTVVIDSTDIKSPAKELRSEFNKMINDSGNKSGFATSTNGKAEVLLNKKFGWYQPNLIVSKSILNSEGDIALVNNVKIGNWVYTATGDYNLYNLFQAGGQVMYKTPNFECFAGSDQLFKTVETTNSFLNKNDAGSGYTGASLYFGFAFKFGPDVEHPHNANTIPGFKEDRIQKSFFRRLLFWRK